MPRQNRVTPFGEIVAHPARGNLMGNRGCLHNHQGQIVRFSNARAWISCVTEWPGVKRHLMAPGQYTELFFHDEATALAAGHRPCGDCRRDALRSFKMAWAAALALDRSPTVRDIDTVLAGQRGQRHDCSFPEALPEGTMVTVDGSRPVWMRHAGQWMRWSFDGYEPVNAIPTGTVRLVTPPAIVAAMRAGYRPEGL